MPWRKRNSDVPEERRIILRVGINLGDVIVEENDIYGDGVNVAARLEGLAEPGGICVSRAVRREVQDKIDVAFEDLGQLEAKNIARPIHAYRVLVDAAEAERLAMRVKAYAVSGRRVAAAVAALALVLTVAGIAVWWQPWKLAVESAPSMAVLPFTIQAGGDAERYFSDGLTEDVIFCPEPVLRIDDRIAHHGFLIQSKQLHTETDQPRTGRSVPD